MIRFLAKFTEKRTPRNSFIARLLAIVIFYILKKERIAGAFSGGSRPFPLMHMLSGIQ